MCIWMSRSHAHTAGKKMQKSFKSHIKCAYFYSNTAATTKKHDKQTTINTYKDLANPS